MNGPVPLTSRTMACSPSLAGSIVASSQPESWIANEGEASRAGNATSGSHRSKTTVAASGALIRRRRPVYGPWAASGAPTSPQGASASAG